MKTSRFLLVAASALVFAATPGRADDLLGMLLDSPASSAGSQRPAKVLGAAKGLQLASGLQLSAPLNGGGPAPIAARLSEDEWRKTFPRKEPRR